MANALDPDPGGGGLGDQKTSSYAERLKTNVNYDQRLKRNVLEIQLEKSEKDVEIVLDQDCVARVCRSIGIDIVSEVEGYQIQYNGRTSTIFVWVAKGVNLERFCREVGINVAKGVMTSLIRPAGRRDVTVTVTGLDFNTPDSLLFEYIKKFGGIIMNNSVIYSKFSEGPFKGKYSGERKYQVDFGNSLKCMGTYHYIDGARIRIFYRGNEKTCGRCHQSPRNCPGDGLARQCQAAGGVRVQLSDHMRKLWEEIGFKPTSFTLPTNEDTSDEMDKPISENIRFGRNDPSSELNEEERFVGMTIANINIELSDDQVKKFVADNVSDKIEEEQIKINRDKRKIIVTITSMLTPQIIRQAMTKINFDDCKEKIFGRPLYCRPLRDITPVKNSSLKENKTSSTTNNSSSNSNAKAPSTQIKGKTFSTSSSSSQTSDKTPPNSSLNSSSIGTKSNLIPGLSPQAQAKALKKEKQKIKALEKKNKDEKILDNQTAFDVLMKAQQQFKDPRDDQLPPNCSTSHLKSWFGQQVSAENRRLSFGSSPNLKRGPDQLSSPNSPQPSGDIKKSKSRENLVQ